MNKTCRHVKLASIRIAHSGCGVMCISVHASCHPDSVPCVVMRLTRVGGCLLLGADIPWGDLPDSSR